MVVTPEHLDELKAGSSFALPMSSFTESQPFSESFARKWGPMIARAHAKREGKETPGDMHPVVMVLEPKANALNISPLVSERQAEWITHGEFTITQVGDDNGLTVVHLKQTNHRVSKADWEPKEHPRGGDPENRGRFSRVLERERPKAAIWTQLADAEVEPEVEAVVEEPMINITQGLISIAPKHRAKSQISIAPQAEISIVPKQISIAQPTISIAPEKTISIVGAPAEIHLAQPEIAVKPTVKPEVKPDLAPKDKHVDIGDGHHNYYTVIHESDYDTDMNMISRRFTNSQAEAGSIATEMREDKIQELLDIVTGSRRTKKVHVVGIHPETGETMYAEVSPEAYAHALRRVAEHAQPAHEWDELEITDSYEDVTWHDAHGNEIGEDFPWIEDKDLVEQSGVHPSEFHYRVLSVKKGHADESMTRLIGRGKVDLSGQFVEAGPTISMEDNEGRSIPVTPIRPYG
jgi:hypothetical protein